MTAILQYADIEDDTFWNEFSKKLSSHADYFNHMMELIPPRYYFDNSGKDEEWAMYMSKQSIVSPKVTAKESKKGKLDPESYLTVPGIMEHKAETQNISTAGDTSEVEIETIPGFSDGNAERDELRMRIRDKINNLRLKRKVPPVGSENSGPPRKRQRVEAKKNESNKKKKIEKKPPQKQTTEADKTNQSKANSKTNPKTNTPHHSGASEDIEYSALDTEEQPVQNVRKKKKAPTKQMMLQRAQENQKRLQELKGTDKGEKLKTDIAWQNMKKKAQGEKVKDDINKLKKSVKRDQQKKKKSQREWKARIDSQKRTKKAAIKQREKNIENAKTRGKRGTTGRGKPKKRPGFEGKKKDFINK